MNNQVIVITGAATGIGRSIAEAFIEETTNKLILLDSNIGMLEEWIGSLNDSARVLSIKCDISNMKEVLFAFSTIREEYEYINVLVNSAGVCDENEPDDVSTWNKVININLNGTFYVTAQALHYLSDNGRIINISSILGRAGKVRNTAYCASKHGIIGITKALALDLAPRKITVNAILPAWVDTPMLQKELEVQAHITGIEVKKIVQNAKKKLPQKRFIAAKEIASLVQYLCTDSAKGITAQSLIVDGGAGLGM